MDTNQIQVTLKGTTFADVIAQAAALVEAAGTLNPAATATAVRKGKKAATPAIEESFVDETETDNVLEAAEDETSFDELEEPTPKPAKKAAAKTTQKQVNDAAMAHAKKHGRKETLKILATKFKVKSILELKDEHFAAALKALAV